MNAKILAISLAMTASALASEPLPLWPNGAPGQPAGANAEVDKTPNEDTIRLSNVSVPVLTLFPAPKEKATGAAVVVCPGGGYQILAYNKEGTEICEWLNSLGITAVLLKYRVPFGREKALQDAQRALGVVRQHAQEWKIDPGKVGIIGFSAGAHLSAALSASAARRIYDPVDAADAQSCRPDFAMLIYPAYLVADGDAARIAPEVAPTEKTPPTFLAQTEDDHAHIESSIGYYLALKRAKVPAELHLYPKGGHGYGLRPGTVRVSTEWPRSAAQWLAEMGLASAPKPGAAK